MRKAILRSIVSKSNGPELANELNFYDEQRGNQCNRENKRETHRGSMSITNLTGCDNKYGFDSKDDTKS